MKKLIIAEKPSLAKSVAEGVKLGGETPVRADGYLESNTYIITWCFGHLLELIDLEEYASDYELDEKHSWTLSNLPFYPGTFRYELKRDRKTKKADSGIKKQYETIKKLAKRNDVEAIVNAGDADREGEIIIRNVLDKMGNTKPVYRLWMPDQTPQTIKYELANMKPDSNYNDMANEGLARTYMDWLYGINLTRYVTLKANAHSPLRVGRVLSPIVKAIYDRDMAILNFKPQQYIVIQSKEITGGNEIELTSKNDFGTDKNRAKAAADQYNRTGAKVTDLKTEQKTISAGKLFSLSKLQGLLAKKYKMSMADSLSTIQTLYEKGYLTYPRTNTEYLAEEEKGKVNAIIGILEKQGYDIVFKDKKSIFDSSKIESHSAITPTFKIPNLDSLSESERNVYETVLRRFLAVFCKEEYKVDRTTITIAVGNLETFTIKGDVMIQKGWTKYEENSKQDKVLPKLEVGQSVNINFKPTEKETQPPKRYTVESLNEYLKNPFKEDKKNLSEEEAEEEEYRAIFEGLELGTEATRTGIIENAIANKYISLKNNTYKIEERGKYLIETMVQLHVNMDKYETVKMSKALKQVYRKDISIQEAIVQTQQAIDDIFSHKDITVTTKEPGAENVCFGKCPKCGADVKKGKFGIYCTGKCGLFFGKIRGKDMTDSQWTALLSGKRVLIKNLATKEGKKYDMTFKVSHTEPFTYESAGEKRSGYRIVFDEKFPDKKKKGMEYNITLKVPHNPYK